MANSKSIVIARQPSDGNTILQANENSLNIDQRPSILGIDPVYGTGFVNPSNNQDPGMLHGDNEDSESVEFIYDETEVEG